VDLDTEGPALAITEPDRAQLNELPERAAGFAADPGGIDSLGFRFVSDSEYGPVSFEVSGDTLHWEVPWPEDLDSDGTYELSLYAVDSPGHTAQSSKEIVIDTQAPEAPDLVPPPPQVRHPRLTVTGTCSARDSVFLDLNGETVKRFACSAAGAFSQEVTLAEGLNMLQAAAGDKAGNRSAPSEPVNVTYVKSVGIVVPERFGDGSVIDFTLAKEADLIELRVYTLGGSHVATVTKASPDPVDELSWDLRDTEGKQVRNGPYLMVFEIVYSDGDRKLEKQAVMVIR
jgi:hypothetical protein